MAVQHKLRAGEVKGRAVDVPRLATRFKSRQLPGLRGSESPRQTALDLDDVKLGVCSILAA